MVKSTRQSGASESGTSPSMLLLYVAGSMPEIDQSIIEQLHRLSSARSVIPVAGAAGAVAEIRKAKSGILVGLLLSPSLGDNDVAPLILEVRYEAKAVAVVGIGEARRAFRLVVAGADAVLVASNGVLVNAEETLRSVALRTQPVVLREPADGGDAGSLGNTRSKMVTGLRKFSLLVSDRATEWWADDDPEMDNAAPPEAPTSPEDLLLIKERLNLALEARLRLEAQGPFPAALPSVELSEAAVATAAAVAPDVLKEWVPSWQRSDKEPAAVSQAEDASEIKAQLRRAIDAHRQDKLEWDATRHELEEALVAHQAAVGVGAELETVLNETRNELVAVRDAYKKKKTDFESKVKTAQGEVARALETQKTDQEAWATTRQELEAQLGALKTSAASAADLDATLKTTQGELAHAIETHKADQQTWMTARQDLETRLKTMQTSSTAASDLEVTLNVARSELARAKSAQLSEQRSWATARQDLETKVVALKTAVATKVDLETTLNTARTELQRALDAHHEDQQTWIAEREELEAQLSAERGSSVARLESDAALNATRTELRRALDAQRADQIAWETSRQDLEARIAAERSASSVADFDGTVAAMRAELRAALEAHRADELAWEGARLALGSRINDLEAEMDSRSQIVSRLNAAKTELSEATLADPKRMEWATRRRQLESALDAEAMTSASIDFETAATQTLTELDRAANVWSKQATGVAGMPLEQALGVARTGLQRALDAHAAAVAAWDLTRQHIEAELQEALLDAQGQRARVIAAREALDTSAGAKTVAIDSVA